MTLSSPRTRLGQTPGLTMPFSLHPLTLGSRRRQDGQALSTWRSMKPTGLPGGGELLVRQGWRWLRQHEPQPHMMDGAYRGWWDTTGGYWGGVCYRWASQRTGEWEGSDEDILGSMISQSQHHVGCYCY